MSHRKHLIVGLAVALLTVLGSVSGAEAQGYPPPYYPPPPPPPPPHGVYRAGIIYGFAVGLGAIGSSTSGFCAGDSCGAAVLGEAHIGGMISPRAALMFEVWGADHPWTDPNSNSRETINTFVAGAAQYWINEIFWIKGGVGFAVFRDTITDYYGNTAESDVSGFGLYGAAGVEVLQMYNFALDLQGRIGSGFYKQDGASFNAQNYAFMVGFNWY